MDETSNYAVKDLSLAEQGLRNIEFAEREMGALMKVKERFSKEKPLRGQCIGMALHVTKETAVLVKTLIAGGADVAICSCNPLSTQDDVAAALAKSGVKVFGYKGETKEDYYKFINAVIAAKPSITIDDGCDLVSEIHSKHPELIPNIKFGNEETTTGVIRLKSMEKEGALKYPMIAVNDLDTKHLFDNFYGTGASTIDGITRATNVLLAGKTFVVCGYGQCGKGVALRAKGMGANVIVTEVNALNALQAKMDGYGVMPLSEAAKEGEIFVTVTGNKHVITTEHMKLMGSGTILANSGHFDVEIDVEGLEKISVKKRNIRPQLDEYTLKDGRKIFLVGSGRLCNLSAAEGHPSVVMAMSFCGQALAVEYGLKNLKNLKVGVNTLPKDVDERIAELQLEALGVKKDVLSDIQKKYLSSWSEGT
ncbi:MAG: adenosylhomocysteinase [archaeon]